MATATPNYSSLLGLQADALPDALKPRKVMSYPTAAPGEFNQQAFALAGVPQNYVPPPPPPPKTPTPSVPNVPNLQNLNLGGMFGNINLQALLAQYGGLLGGQAPQQQVPATPARPTAQAASPLSSAAIQALIAQYSGQKQAPAQTPAAPVSTPTSPYSAAAIQALLSRYRM